jgi:hypothetical protein
MLMDMERSSSAESGLVGDGALFIYGENLFWDGALACGDIVLQSLMKLFSSGSMSYRIAGLLLPNAAGFVMSFE